MSTLSDVLLTEQLVAAFGGAIRSRPDVNATLVRDPAREADVVGDGGTAARIATTDGRVLYVNPRRIGLEEGEAISDVVLLADLVGYDWISPELADKVRMEKDHYDRMYLYVRAARQVVLEHLGPAVYPLMAYLAGVLQLRSRELLRRADPDAVALITKCMVAASEGPFFRDEEMDELFSQDRAALQILATTWTRMNLASPDLGRTVSSVVEMLVARQQTAPHAWDEWIGASAIEVLRALAAFQSTLDGPGTRPNA